MFLSRKNQLLNRPVQTFQFRDKAGARVGVEPLGQQPIVFDAVEKILPELLEVVKREVGDAQPKRFQFAAKVVNVYS